MPFAKLTFLHIHLQHVFRIPQVYTTTCAETERFRGVGDGLEYATLTSVLGRSNQI